MTQPHQSEDATMKPVARREKPPLPCPRYGGCTYPDCEHFMDISADAVDRGPLTQPAELFDEAVWAEFDLARSVDKGERLARRDDQQAAALDLQALDVIRRAGL